MGVMTLAVTMLLAFVHFPMWGSMFFPANPDISEEDYYIQEWTAEEVAKVRQLKQLGGYRASLPVWLQCLCGLLHPVGGQGEAVEAGRRALPAFTA